ncbi:hypothetical protein Dsin_002020 [Dipteronia sinensis]|uniref:Uncharacterized protein n=1 Tax=Dipteronia sinensis TaxID=43782 RepID=A0AAE0EJA4_9ROSI|nr:hypothetical protein Dsin_002020 [Dipteronia sinensis]
MYGYGLERSPSPAQQLRRGSGLFELKRIRLERVKNDPIGKRPRTGRMAPLQQGQVDGVGEDAGMRDSKGWWQKGPAAAKMGQI